MPRYCRRSPEISPVSVGPTGFESGRPVLVVWSPSRQHNSQSFLRFHTIGCRTNSSSPKPMPARLVAQLLSAALPGGPAAEARAPRGEAEGGPRASIATARQSGSYSGGVTFHVLDVSHETPDVTPCHTSPPQGSCMAQNGNRADHAVMPRVILSIIQRASPRHGAPYLDVELEAAALPARSHMIIISVNKSIPIKAPNNKGKRP